MAIGLVGKPSGVRIVTGSNNYGKGRQEAYNLQHREFPVRSGGRSIMIIGQTAKQIIEVIQPVPVAPVKKARKPSTKSAAKAQGL